jgi:hypothetical protein
MSSPASVAAPDGLHVILGHGGLGISVVTAEGGDWPALMAAADGVVRLGVHRGGPMPTSDLDWFDLLLSADAAASTPWVGFAPERLQPAVVRIQEVIARQPVAAAVAVELLRVSLSVSFDQALTLESMGYSMLLASDGFQRWRQTTPRRSRPEETTERVVLSQELGALQIRLSRPGSRNAVDAAMRDGWVDALEFARDDPEQRPVILDGVGASFSAGGDLDEFGTARDPGIAHAIRVLQSPARLMRSLGTRLRVNLHGACIGAGIEAAAAAAHVVGRRGAYFRLPEVSMGLIPGAGGTATIPRRVGRHRACYMTLSGVDVDMDTALRWGLADSVE